MIVVVLVVQILQVEILYWVGKRVKILLLVDWIILTLVIMQEIKILLVIIIPILALMLVKALMEMPTAIMSE